MKSGTTWIDDGRDEEVTVTQQLECENVPTSATEQHHLSLLMQPMSKKNDNSQMAEPPCASHLYGLHIDLTLLWQH